VLEYAGCPCDEIVDRIAMQMSLGEAVVAMHTAGFPFDGWPRDLEREAVPGAS